MDVINGPCESLGLLMDKINQHGKPLGMMVFSCNYFKNNMKLKWFLFSYFLFVIMTFYTFNQVSNNFVSTAFSCVTFAVLLQSLVKIPMFLVNSEKFIQLTNKFHELYLRNKDHPRRKHALDKYLKYSWISYKVMVCLYYLAGVLLSTVPLIIGYLIGARVLPFGIFLPYVDHTSSPGFEINYAFSVYMCYLAMRGWIASESYIVLHIFLGMGHLNMIEVLIDDLNEQLNSTINLTEQKIQGHIREIIFEHQKLLAFSKSFESMFSFHTLVMVLSASFMIVACMLVLVKQMWLLGLVLISLGVLQILLICLMGTFFEQRCLSLSEKLYMTDWYLFSPKLRKDWYLIMQMASNPTMYTMGGVLPSNLSTFMMVIQKMYTILMMLLNMTN